LRAGRDRPARLSAAPPTVGDPETPAHVLVVDDEPALRKNITRILAARGMQVTTAENGEEGLEHLESKHPDVALVDLMMPKLNGLEMLSRAKAAGSATEFVMMTAHGGLEEAVTAVKLGAYHFLTKPFESNEIVVLTIAQAAEHKRLVDRTHRLERALEAKERFGELIGNSPRMLEVYRLIEGVATATSTVLILGESGTGKELVARAIHQRGARASKPFVAVNCAAIPKDLVESELFGHVRGAFTGAQSARAGLFETAHTGTIFLDEVGDLPLATQVKLLRTLQEGEVKRVGSDETRNVDVRVLAATNVDLRSHIDAGSFRTDLYYRLNVISISLPPLRERGDDVLLLAYHFIDKYARRLGRESKRLGPDATQATTSYAWPGNVRELEHAIERAVVFAQGPLISARDLPAEMRPDTIPSPSTRSSRGTGRLALPAQITDLPFAEAKRVAMLQFEEAYVAEMMRRSSGNVSEAARQAGVDRSNFKRIVRKAKTDPGA
jgi:two-component system response regulator HydG